MLVVVFYKKKIYVTGCDVYDASGIASSGAWILSAIAWSDGGSGNDASASGNDASSGNGIAF